jgi:hypothetical protein
MTQEYSSKILSEIDMQSTIVSVKEWIITSLILMVPLVNIFAVLYWSLAKDVNPSKQNLMRAIILLFIICVTVFVVLGVLGLSMMSVVTFAP